MAQSTSISDRGYIITPVRSVDDLAASISLFQAYAASLGIDLAFQDFAAEMASMPGKYAQEKGGELLLARQMATGDPIGCVALRALHSAEDHGPSTEDASNCARPSRRCEMKRLYVAPAGRGLGIGRALAAAVLDAAEALGYVEVRLDTLPSMVAAVAMYSALGFEEIEPYYSTPLEGTKFLSLRLPRTVSNAQSVRRGGD